MSRLYLLLLFCFFFHFSNAQTYDKKGHKQGYWRVFDNETKQLIFEGEYNHGDKKGRFITYYTNDKIKDVNFFKKNLLHGLQKRFAENGVVLWTCNYVKGIKHGTETYYYANGNLKAVLNYSNGNINGVEKHYSIDGEEIKFEHFTKKTIIRK